MVSIQPVFLHSIAIVLFLSTENVDGFHYSLQHHPRQCSNQLSSFEIREFDASGSSFLLPFSRRAIFPLYARKGGNKKRQRGSRGGRKGGGTATATGVLEKEHSTIKKMQRQHQALVIRAENRNVDLPRCKMIEILLNQTPLEESSSLNPSNLLPAPLRVYTYQINDATWWQQNENSNPYGARLWPSSLSIAQFLARSLPKIDGKINVLELGCGAGLVSIAAAASCCSGGDKNVEVVATDISPVALSLTQKGWQKTVSSIRKQMRRQIKTEEKKKSDPNEDDDGGLRYNSATTSVSSNELSIMYFDICDKSTSLPISPSSPIAADAEQKQQSILIAATMLYESTLAKALAHRVVEAIKLGAWIIVGDCDTGEREGGRHEFLSELDRLLGDIGGGGDVPRVWTEGIIQNQSVGWMGKSVKLLHVNAPPGALL